MVMVCFVRGHSGYSDDSLFAPTPMDVIEGALNGAGIKSDDILYDLGCGDGRACITASKAFGCRSVGIDIDVGVVAIAKNNVKKNQLDDLVRIYNSDVLKTDWSQASVVYIYLMPHCPFSFR